MQIPQFLVDLTNLISKNLVNSTRSCEIKPCHYSDHDFVHLSIDTRSFCNRGPGVWHLNTSVLSDPEYVNLIETLFDSYPRPSTDIPLGQQWWHLKKKSNSP